MVKLAGKLLLAAGLLLSAGAHAGTYNLGTLPTGVSQQTESVGPGAFSDTFDFTLAGLSQLGVGAAASNITIFGMPVFDISNLSVSVYNSHNVKIGSGTDINLGTLSGGNYYAVVTGNATGTNGGIFSAAFSVAAVPEASTWAMLLAGLMMVAYTVRRKA